eukprot:jgi/Chlat1/4496/Chrsp29S04434
MADSSGQMGEYHQEHYHQQQEDGAAAAAAAAAAAVAGEGIGAGPEPEPEPGAAGGGEGGGVGGELSPGVIRFTHPLASQSVKAIAFNAYASSVRTGLRAAYANADSGPEALAEVEKLIGVHWAELPLSQKQPFIAQARSDKAEFFRQNGWVGSTDAIDNAVLAMGDDGTVELVKRKRGRPPKLREDGTAAPAPLSSSVPRRKYKARVKPAQQAAEDTNVIGTQVDGIVDGIFDVGLFITARVAGPSGQPIVLRGLVFRPDVATPIDTPNGLCSPSLQNVPNVSVITTMSQSGEQPQLEAELQI